MEPTACSMKGRMRIRARQIRVVAEGGDQMNDVVSRHRLSPVNAFLQHPSDKVVVDHSLIPPTEVDKLNCQTMRRLTPQRRSDDAVRQVEVEPRRQRGLGAAPMGGAQQESPWQGQDGFGRGDSRRRTVGVVVGGGTR